MSIHSKHFGNIGEAEIRLFTLTNKKGMKVTVMNYGATITSIHVPQDSGEMIQVACGFDSLEEYFSEDYKDNAPYFGCTVGRYASRIKNGKFNINGIDYITACNDGSNHLHGGVEGFDKKIWMAQPIDNTLAMTLNSPDLDEGYPGNVKVKVTFELTEANAIVISYSAQVDHATPLSLTNHTYFNLSGFHETIEQHNAQIEAHSFLQPDHTNVPVGEVTKVQGTAADLRKEKVLANSFKDLDTGFEHYYVFDQYDGELQEVARFRYPPNGLELKIATTEPGALFYTGYFTSDKLKRNSGETYGRYKGLCLETSRYPNGPNLENSPMSITTKDQSYKSVTRYTFNNSPDQINEI